mmetsp:Transcript_63180/g.150655  ORF Transcript_63180/g.150655 Transcript_63180/m.150655 type:complete len:159 (+) Transcript_63180:105-581(+)|eukprot:CAMPEP_0178413792 /NCGR_PEP_ID=MMETSP0689_2-20121128/22708_1 /TAXON_ID=160604 /ORGANISM="Amphidinium massartii, Strain CS-259" /LENGTH=158 /DNA_ID=CAMNT_0020035071 /DNA_START=61 /DNA_END=537 /DNA_ORIENTATION=+
MILCTSQWKLAAVLPIAVLLVLTPASLVPSAQDATCAQHSQAASDSSCLLQLSVNSDRRRELLAEDNDLVDAKEVVEQEHKRTDISADNETKTDPVKEPFLKADLPYDSHNDLENFSISGEIDPVVPYNDTVDEPFLDKDLLSNDHLPLDEFTRNRTY